MKKAREILIFSTFVFLLLLTGWLFFQWRNGTSIHQTANDFRTWFWSIRSLDLVVQILLVFAGALAIAAILPFEEKHD